MYLLLGAALAILAWGLAYLWRIAPVSAGYKAKVLCSAIFVSQRDIDTDRADDISADSYRILRIFSARVDRISKTVTVSCFGFRPRTAVYRPGLGATLGCTDPAVQIAAAVDAADEEIPIVEHPALRRIVEAAFTEPNPRRLRRTRAVVIVRNGQVVAERYAPGFSAQTPLPGWSMTKSVLSALVGILVGEGTLALRDKGLLPEWTKPDDPRSDITVEDLLRMRSGLEFSENYADLFSDVNQMLFVRHDSAAVAAAKPLAWLPGTSWQYSSGSTNLLSVIVRRAVGERDYLGFPRRALFEPLGMKSAVMEPDAAGTFLASSFMFATARDWARFGRLYLQEGLWEGRRILPEGWVRMSVTPTPESPDASYGAHWWLKLQKELGGETEAAKRIPSDAFFALGHEGQTLTVIPSRGIVAVRLGLSIYIDAWNHAQFVADLLDALA